MDEEIWKGVKGFEDLYEVSTLGNIRRADNKFPIKPVKVAREKYPVVGLWKNGVAKTKRVHRIVAEAFLPKPEGKNQIDHIDTDVFNNRVDNLRWCTPLENANNPLTLKHNSEGQKRYSQKEGVHEKKVEIAKATREKHKEIFDSITERLIAYSKSEEGRRKNSEAQKRYYLDPANIEKNRQAQIKYNKEHPEKAKRAAEISKERMKDPKEREKVFLGSLHRAKPLYCIETGKTFLSGGQADREYGLWSGSANTSANRGIGADHGKLHFIFIDK